MEFESLELREEPVTIGGESFVLREADEATARAFRNASTAGVVLNDGKLAGLPKDLGGLQGLLVCNCLYRVGADGKAQPKPVPYNIISKWPARIVKALFEKAKEISDLDEEEEEAAKNEQSDTTTGSQ